MRVAGDGLNLPLPFTSKQHRRCSNSSGRSHASGVRIVVVGGGILGTMHARWALDRGHQVVHVEREPVARGASVRNFGLVWVSGRADGPELATALRARELWEQLSTSVPGVGFRPAGSLTVCRTDAELAVAKEAVAGPGAEARGFALLDPARTRQCNPALRGVHSTDVQFGARKLIIGWFHRQIGRCIHATIVSRARPNAPDRGSRSGRCGYWCSKPEVE